MDDTLRRRLRDWNFSWSPSSPAYESNQHFINSLRKYPDPAKYSILIERLIRNIQNKHFNRTQNASKINKTFSKRTQTFNKRNFSAENIMTEYEKKVFSNQYNESYDYLNASGIQRSTWLVPNLEARYVYDLKKYIKKKLRQICDDALPLRCNDIRNRYERHRREHHQHGPSSEHFSETSKKSQSKCIICYRPKPCSCNNEHTTTSRDLFEDRFQKAITEWISKLPVYLDDSPDNNQRRKEMVNELVSDVQKLKNDADITEFDNKVKFLAEGFLNEYPMWSPQDPQKREEFIKYLVEDLVDKLNKEKEDSNVCTSEESILKMINNIAANDSKQDFMKEVLVRLKPLAQENAKNNTKYKEDIKTGAIDVLNKISREKNIDSKDDVIRDLAEKLSDYLTSIRRLESQSSQTDKEEPIKHNEDSKIAIKSEFNIKHESDSKFAALKTDITRHGSNNKSEVRNNQPLESHASKSLSRSFSRMLPEDEISLDDTANITELKQVPSRKTSLKFSHKRWIKKERSKHKSRKYLNYSSDLKDTIKDQVVRANNNENMENASQLVLDNSEIIKSVHYPEERTVSAINDSIDHNASNKITVDALETTSSKIQNTSTHHPNKQIIKEVVQQWIDELPVNLYETKEMLANSLTSDIEVGQKFKDMKLDNENDDIGFLKYNLFKQLCQVLSNEQLTKVIHEVNDLMKKLDNINIRDTSNESNDVIEIKRPSHSQVQRKPITSAKVNNTTNKEAYLSEDDEQNDFISSNINNIVDKSRSQQSNEHTSLNDDDYDLLQQIRKRSMLHADQSHIDDISKEIANKTNIFEPSLQENNEKHQFSSVTQTKDTVERSIQVNKEETFNPKNNIQDFDYLHQNNDSNKGTFENSKEYSKNLLLEHRTGCDDELFQSEIMDSFPNCIFCRTKYAAEARRCRRLQRKSSQDNVDEDNYRVLCHKCGLKCSYPSRMFFC